jgi:histidine kinase
MSRDQQDFQQLFEIVPCTISVQDRNYRLIRYNREFETKFSPTPDDFCYQAYKGRDRKCENCPVEKTFLDGRVHYSEEVGVDKEGIPVYWFVKTSPIRNTGGDIVAAMEMCIDITNSKLLEEQLKKMEKKYYAIFNNIPNPVFVVDRETLEILECNASVLAVYGYGKKEVINRSFLDFFKNSNKAYCRQRLCTSSVLNQVRHVSKENKTIYVDIWISPFEYPDRKVLLITTSDITRRLETEQQLIHASKMATLGEMATGVAHELNQPLSVIKTAGSFFMNKIEKQQRIEDEILYEMATEIDLQVDRAARIISHMRQFGRKSDLRLEPVNANDVLTRAFEIFCQQLSVRGIRVEWDIDKNLPEIMADPNRLEQVFINLLINARDALEEKYGDRPDGNAVQKILLKTCSSKKQVRIEIGDTGPGVPVWALDKIFEPFFTTKEPGKGTGLGLSISYSIIKDCGGEIKVHSTPDTGALFVMTFPAL